MEAYKFLVRVLPLEYRHLIDDIKDAFEATGYSRGHIQGMLDYSQALTKDLNEGKLDHILNITTSNVLLNPEHVEETIEDQVRIDYEESMKRENQIINKDFDE